MEYSPSDGESTNGQPHPGHPGGLPPVEPPSARFILQLFLVPGILVALVVGFIWLFFGWLGGGPEKPEEFIDGLRSSNEQRRWRTAQDLAQVLPRKKELRGDVGFALAITNELNEGLKTEPASDAGEKADLMEFLPAASGTFHVPVAAPVLIAMIEKYRDAIAARDPLSGEDANLVYVNAKGLRLRNAVVALGLLGARMKEYDELPDEQKARIRDDLRSSTAVGEEQQRWAKLALQYLENRDLRVHSPDRAEDILGIGAALDSAAQSKDELTCKYAILAAANWDEPGIDGVLVRAANAGGVEILVSREDGYKSRAAAEIRYNAMLALARRNQKNDVWESTVTDQILNPEYLKKAVYKDDKSRPAVDIMMVKALRDLREWTKQYESPDKAFESQPRVKEAVVKLTEYPNAAVQVEAKRVLGQETTLPGIVAGMSRQTLLIIGLSAAIGLLLLLAVVSRWRRKPPVPEPM